LLFLSDLDQAEPRSPVRRQVVSERCRATSIEPFHRFTPRVFHHLMIANEITDAQRRQAGLPGPEEVAGPAECEIAFRDLEPVSRLDERVQTIARRRRHRVLIQQDTRGRVAASADAPAQLVQLRQPEPLRVRLMIPATSPRAVRGRTRSFFPCTMLPVSTSRSSGRSGFRQPIVVDEHDTIIVGHDKLMKPADLKEYADFNNDFITWVQGEMKAGKTVDQAAAEWKPGPKYPGYGPPPAFFGGIKGNIQTAYNELKK
jgi:hypothetical protein